MRTPTMGGGHHLTSRSFAIKDTEDANFESGRARGMDGNNAKALSEAICSFVSLQITRLAFKISMAYYSYWRTF